VMTCDCDGDELAFVDATGDDRVVEMGAGDVDEISGEGFLLRFFAVGAGTGVVGVGWGEAVAEMGERASGD
jgi:arginine decarboxylase-like protein